ncbi:MAG: multiprotein bridging factor aMBF1 [Candidatus Bilamarchaeum sp.]
MGNLSCEICGRASVSAQVYIEGAKLMACSVCMRGGKILQRFENEAAVKVFASEVAPAASFDTGEEIVDDYASLIRHALERLKLPLPVVAEKIKEKESYLRSIESGHLMPSIPVAKKLEKELGVKLIEKEVSTVAPVQVQKKFGALTLGDMIEIESEKSKKKK